MRAPFFIPLLPLNLCRDSRERCAALLTMKDFLKFGYLPLFYVFAAALIIAWFFGAESGLAAALAGIAVLFFLHLRKFREFVLWLEKTNSRPNTEAAGVWQDIYEKVYAARRKTEKDQLKLEEKELRFRQTLSALPDGIVLVRKDWEIQWLNRIAERDLLLDSQGDVGKKLPELLSNRELAGYLTSENWKRKLLVQEADGRFIEVRVTSAGKKYTIVITRDVTESKRIDDFRRDFVANVSHELRTPLTVIKGFLELSSENPKLTDEDRLHWKMMIEQTERMGSLVDDLLTLSSLERDTAPAEKDPIDVIQMLEDSAAEGRIVSGGAHEIRIVRVSAAAILGNLKEMRSAVTNLVTNAVRYTPKNGKIELSWEEVDGSGVLTVKDNGIGIASEDIPRVTERFYRVDKSRSRETGGTGLGLAIVKHVLFRHQAKLEIESELGKGSAFRIVIPKARIREPELAQETQAQ